MPAEASPRKAGFCIQPNATVGSHATRGCSAYDLITLSQRDCDSVGTRDGQSAFGDQLKDFVQDKLFKLPVVRGCAESGGISPGFFSATASNLLVQGGKCE
jgi:hypothetical protein